MKTILYLVMVLVWVSSVSAQSGSLVGSIAFTSKNGKTFFKFSPKTSIVLKVKDKTKKVIVSDENGDYLPELPVGKYCIYSVKNENGIELQLQDSQHKCFKIGENKTTRFDIMLLD